MSLQGTRLQDTSLQNSIAETSADKIIARKDGHIGRLIFNNPARHNAMSLDMWQTSLRVLQDFREDHEIRVVVLTGAGGKAFVSGADISRFGDERANLEAVVHYNNVVEDVYSTIAEFPKPTIASIRGYCIGGGLGLAIACDLRICSEQSRFALPAAKLGLGYGSSGIKRFVEQIGPTHTKEIFFTARQYSAAEAHHMGVVNRILPDAEIEAYIEDYAATIAGNAPLTIAATKAAAVDAVKDPTQRDPARVARLIEACFTSADYREGRTAFVEKRKPEFQGR